MEQDLTFALVVDRQIILYPLTYDDINARNNPMEDYLYCYDEPKPTIQYPVFQYLEPVPKLVGISVQVGYVIKQKTLEEIFTLIGLGSGSTITIAEVAPEHLEAVVILTKERVQGQLDAFATTRGYDDIKSVCTYINSQIPQYQTEAARAIYLRDLTWSTLYTYLNGIMTGSTPLPESWDDIQVNLPALTWT